MPNYAEKNHHYSEKKTNFSITRIEFLFHRTRSYKNSCCMITMTIAGHPRVFKTHELINRHYWWLSQLRDVKTYVKGCITCQQNKASRQKKAAPLNPHPLPESPWESISLDIIGLLPKSNGFDAILSVIDRFSKMICLIPKPQSY